MRLTRGYAEIMSEPETDCLFCRIVAREVPAEVVHETDTTLAFRDIAPHAPVHVLVVPKEHRPTVVEMARDDPAVLAAVMLAAGDVARSEGLEQGYRLVVNTGPDAGQTVFHTHVHLLGGRAMTSPMA
jgi:histidine triad (HIT) family protein